jgi:hypothetical protein
MTAPTGGYGAASQPRADAFDLVSQNQVGTHIVAILIANGQEVARSGVFDSGHRPGRNSIYAMRNDQSQETRMSRNDAEVGALDWAHNMASRMTGDVKSINVSLVANRGTCNGCKVRQQLLATNLGRMFPSTARSSSRSGRSSHRISVSANYDYARPQSASDGRRDLQTNAVLSTYGYNDATLRSNSYTKDNLPGVPDQYWQYKHTPGGSDGYVPPGQVSYRERNTPPTSDRGSPHWSSSSEGEGNSPRHASPQAPAAAESSRSAAAPSYANVAAMKDPKAPAKAPRREPGQSDHRSRRTEDNSRRDQGQDQDKGKGKAKGKRR